MSSSYAVISHFWADFLTEPRSDPSIHSFKGRLAFLKVADALEHRPDD